MKRVYAIEDYCAGCRLCEVYCAAAHSEYPDDILKTYKKSKAQPRLFVEIKKPVSFSLQCRHCDDSPCVNACITGAMKRDKETGVIICDTEKCVGCWTCILVCPYGAVRRGEGKVAAKCDMCGERGTPACVENCPNEALVFE